MRLAVGDQKVSAKTSHFLKDTHQTFWNTNSGKISPLFQRVITNKQSKSDTLRVYLCSNVSPYNVIDSAKGILDSVTHTGSFAFNNSPIGNYYIKLIHRNCIETWSSNPQSLNGISNYDFTSASSQAFGNNLKQADTAPLRYAFFSGDINQDGTIDASDVSSVENDVFNSFADAQDVSIVDNNAFNSVSAVTP